MKAVIAENTTSDESLNFISCAKSLSLPVCACVCVISLANNLDGFQKRCKFNEKAV